MQTERGMKMDMTALAGKLFPAVTDDMQACGGAPS